MTINVATSLFLDIYCDFFLLPNSCLIVNYAEDETSPLPVITQQTPCHIVTGSALIFQSLPRFTSKIIS